MVEIEFYGEVGTGLGPTLEFYSMLALELQAVSLNMWRCPATLTRAQLFPDGTPHAAHAQQKHLTALPGLGQAPGFGSEPDGGAEDPVTNEFVSSPRGLFPMPILPDSAASAAAAANFTFLGKLLARCMMDGRLFDLPLSPLLFKVSLLLAITICPMTICLTFIAGAVRPIARARRHLHRRPRAAFSFEQVFSHRRRARGSCGYVGGL